jgi:hypothetical protein
MHPAKFLRAQCVAIFLLSASQVPTCHSADPTTQYPLCQEMQSAIYITSIVPVCADWRRFGSWSIERPNGDWLYIVSVFSPETTGQFPDFRTAAVVSFSPKSLLGLRFKGGRAVIERVFTVTGVYRMYFAENIETESDSTGSIWVKVFFINSKK